nr:hypothetical protein [Tanacetum cinerariifolium]
MVLTGHFIDSNWRLQKRVLSFIHLPPPHCGTDIADNLYKCFKDWNIENKVFTISVDNASNNDKAIKNLTEIFSRIKKLPCGDPRCKMTVISLLFLECTLEMNLKLIKTVEDSLSELYENLASFAPKTVKALLCRGDWCRSLHGLKRKNKKEKILIEVILPIT